MDVRHQHGTEIYVVRACHNDDASGQCSLFFFNILPLLMYYTDLVALGGERAVEVLQVVRPSGASIYSYLTFAFSRHPHPAALSHHFTSERVLQPWRGHRGQCRHLPVTSGS
jgi:hypothetical protein